MKKPIEFFTDLKDPRIDRCKDHLLADIIFVTVAAVICGAETWNDIENYGKTKEDWLRKYLKLPNGIPSHDTFNRLFTLLDPKELESSFLKWVKSIAKITKGEVVSIDGKTIRGSKDKEGKSFVHMVSAWANTNKLVLGQVKVDDKSNEITAIPKLLQVLELNGCIVTIDAMGTQTNIADKIIEKGADYILSVKGNQGLLQKGVLDTIRFEKPDEQHQAKDFGHGRIETRTCSVYSKLSHIENPGRWKRLRTIVKIEATRIIKSTGKEEKEERLYITSLEPDAKKIEAAVRSHWGVENELHWILDVSFGEDKSQKKNVNAVENFSIINRIALNLVKHEKTKKRSVKGKRLDAGWDNDYLLKILAN